jgi:hypothetical protein
MRFKLIHPSIVDLYVNTLNLHLLQEKLGVVGPDGLTDELRKTVDEAASSFSIAVRIAEQLFGSSDRVQDQLNQFTGTIGDA